MKKQELETMLKVAGYSEQAIQNILDLYCWEATY
jgi:hypothetical protein